MANTRNSGSKKNQGTQNKDQTVEVLYQRMGDRWFAFSMIDDEIFVGSITPNEIHGTECEEASTFS